jgi:hypothetical protein
MRPSSLLVSFIPVLLSYSRAAQVTTASLAALKSSGFTGAIDLPSDSAFATVTEAWALNYQKTPQVALEPSSTSDVSIAVRSTRTSRTSSLLRVSLTDITFQIKWANKNSYNFALRSGGHSTSQSNDVIIALDKLNT